MVTEAAIQKWQKVWTSLCDMAYHQKDVKEDVFIQPENYHDLYIWSKYDPNFDKLKLEHTWKKYNYMVNGSYIEPFKIEKLRHLYVPRILFEDLGISTFFDVCFPNCQVTFWEDD